MLFLYTPLVSYLKTDFFLFFIISHKDTKFEITPTSSPKVIKEKILGALAHIILEKPLLDALGPQLKGPKNKKIFWRLLDFAPLMTLKHNRFLG